MFWKNKGIDDAISRSLELERSNLELERSNASLKQEIENLKAKLSVIEDEIATDCRTSTMVVDFSAMDAFSVERVLRDDYSHPYTVIGHWVPGPDNTRQTSEWVLTCTKENHEQLVEEFRKYTKKIHS